MIFGSQMPWRCPRGATTCLVPLYVPRSIRPLQGRCCAYTSPPLTTTPEKNGIAEIFVSLAPPQPIFFRVVVSSSECDDKTKEIQRVRIPRPMSSDFSVAVANVPPQPRQPPCPPCWYVVADRSISSVGPCVRAGLGQFTPGRCSLSKTPFFPRSRSDVENFNVKK